MMVPHRAQPTLYVADRGALDDADALIRAHGDDAGFEAAARADRARDLGNVHGYCRWRSIERLIVLLSLDCAIGTLH